MPSKDGRATITFQGEPLDKLLAVQRRLEETEKLKLSLPQVSRYLIDLGFAGDIRNADYLVSSATN